MDVKTRILALRLLEKLEADPEQAQRLGVRVSMVKNQKIAAPSRSFRRKSEYVRHNIDRYSRKRYTKSRTSIRGYRMAEKSAL